jgi:hypothetical protein
MFARDDILERLMEPFITLTSEEITAAESLAVRDAEVAEALRLCRAMAGLADAAIFGEPRTSDAVFLVTLREKISPSTAAVFRPAFGTRRMLATVSVTCMALFVLVLGSSRFSTQFAASEDESLSAVATVLESPTMFSMDSLAQSDMTPDSLASYLGVDGMGVAENWDFADASANTPATDALLELDSETLEEVLNKLEDTNFF